MTPTNELTCAFDVHHAERVEIVAKGTSDYKWVEIKVYDVNNVGVRIATIFAQGNKHIEIAYKRDEIFSVDNSP